VTDITCDCHTHGFRVTAFLEDYWDGMVFLEFWVIQWYADKSILGNLWKRIKLAWKVLRNSDYFLHELILDRDDARRMGQDLIDISNIRGAKE